MEGAPSTRSEPPKLVPFIAHGGFYARSRPVKRRKLPSCAAKAALRAAKLALRPQPVLQLRRPATQRELVSPLRDHLLRHFPPAGAGTRNRAVADFAGLRRRTNRRASRRTN